MWRTTETIASRVDLPTPSGPIRPAIAAAETDPSLAIRILPAGSQGPEHFAHLQVVWMHHLHPFNVSRENPVYSHQAQLTKSMWPLASRKPDKGRHGARKGVKQAIDAPLLSMGSAGSNHATLRSCQICITRFRHCGRYNETRCINRKAHLSYSKRSALPFRSLPRPPCSDPASSPDIAPDQRLQKSSWRCHTPQTAQAP